MSQNDYGLLKSKFLQIYANIPEPLRGEIVAVVGKETFSWSTCRSEVMNDTPNAIVILQQLKKIGVI